MVACAYSQTPALGSCLLQPANLAGVTPGCRHKQRESWRHCVGVVAVNIVSDGTARVCVGLVAVNIVSDCTARVWECVVRLHAFPSALIGAVVCAVVRQLRISRGLLPGCCRQWHGRFYVDVFGS
jgi:hypothetical protein